MKCIATWSAICGVCVSPAAIPACPQIIIILFYFIIIIIIINYYYHLIITKIIIIRYHPWGPECRQVGIMTQCCMLAFASNGLLYYIPVIQHCIAVAQQIEPQNRIDT